MGGLLRYIVAAGVIGVVPIAGKGFSEYRVERLFDAPICQLIRILSCHIGRDNFLRWLDMPSTQVELHNGQKPFHRVVDVRHR